MASRVRFGSCPQEGSFPLWRKGLCDVPTFTKHPHLVSEWEPEIIGFQDLAQRSHLDIHRAALSAGLYARALVVLYVARNDVAEGVPKVTPSSAVASNRLRADGTQVESSPAQKRGKSATAVEGKSGGCRAMVDAYIEEVFRKTGKRITRKDIWSKVGYKSRAEFERWERQDPKHPNRVAADRFLRLLTIEKPHLK